MKKLFVLSLFFLTAVISANAQTTWEKLIANRSTDVFRCVKEVSTGGYVAAGYVADSTVSDTDAYVVKMNTVGDTVWSFRYNGSLSKKDLFYKIIETQDHGFVMCGYTNSVTGLSDDILLVKINSSGQLVWAKTNGGSGKDRAQDIIQVADGSYYLAGYTTSSPSIYYDAFLYHVNSTGDSLWFKRYGNSNYEDANSVRKLSNGGFLLGGQGYNGTNGFDQYLIRVNDSGDTLWTKRFGTTGTDNIECITVTSDGFVLAGGTNGTPSLTDDGYIVKTDTTGTVQWTKMFGGNQPDDFHRVEVTSDGGLVATGTTTSYGPLLPNMWLMRMNSTGDSLWARTFGGDNHDHGYSGQETSDGGYIICGHSGSFGYNNEDGYVVKMDANGNLGNYLTYTSVTSLVSPAATLCGGGSVQVKVIVRNFGNDTVPNVPVTCNITGALTTTLNGTYNGALHPQDADTLVFSTPINTVAFGTYNFTFTTGNNNDVYPANNTYTVSVTIDGTTADPTATDVSRCGPGTVTLTASGTGSINWFNAASGGTLLGSGASFTTPSISTTTTYYVQTGINCPSARIPVSAIVNTIPSNPTTAGGYTCGTGTVQLTANSANTINWYDASSGGTLLGTGSPFTTPSISATTTFYAEANNGSCSSSRVSALASVYTPPADPTVTGGAACGSGSIDLGASAVASINWYNLPTGGTLLGFGNTYTTPVISTTTTYYAVANDGVCTSTPIPVVATINPNPTITLGGGADTLHLISGNTEILDAGSGFVSYAWTPGNETTQTISATVTNLYCVTVTDVNTCIGSDCVYLDFSNGITDVAGFAGSVFPNPATDQINLMLNSDFPQSKIEVLDITGSVVYTTTLRNFFAAETIVIPAEKLSDGIYFIRINNTVVSKAIPVIVQRSK